MIRAAACEVTTPEKVMMPLAPIPPWVKPWRVGAPPVVKTPTGHQRQFRGCASERGLRKCRCTYGGETEKVIPLTTIDGSSSDRCGTISTHGNRVIVRARRKRA